MIIANIIGTNGKKFKRLNDPQPNRKNTPKPRKIINPTIEPIIELFLGIFSYIFLYFFLLFSIFFYISYNKYISAYLNISQQ
jgi:hypothetical protein